MGFRIPIQVVKDADGKVVQGFAAFAYKKDDPDVLERLHEDTHSRNEMSRIFREWAQFCLRTEIHVGEKTFFCLSDAAFWKEPTPEQIAKHRAEMQELFGRKRVTTTKEGVTLRGKHRIGETMVEAINQQEATKP